jgi:hypothetical protein
VTTTQTVKILGTLTHLTYRLDEHEHARRQAEGSPRLDTGELNVLMNLPHGLPVPILSLTRDERRLADRGLLESDGDGNVIRHTRPPLAVNLAMVRATRWRSGLKRAGMFAPYCARAVHLPTGPDDPMALLEAGFYGIGVYTTGDDGGIVVAVEPRPFVRRRWTPAGWGFLEDAYRLVASRPVLTGGAA